MSSNLRVIYGRMIQLAAELARGSCVPDWADEACFSKTTPNRDRAKTRQAFRQIEDVLRDYAVTLRELADSISKEIQEGRTGPSAGDPRGAARPETPHVPPAAPSGCAVETNGDARRVIANVRAILESSTEPTNTIRKALKALQPFEPLDCLLCHHPMAAHTVVTTCPSPAETKCDEYGCTGCRSSPCICAQLAPCEHDFDAAGTCKKCRWPFDGNTVKAKGSNE